MKFTNKLTQKEKEELLDYLNYIHINHSVYIYQQLEISKAIKCLIIQSLTNSKKQNVITEKLINKLKTSYQRNQKKYYDETIIQSEQKRKAKIKEVKELIENIRVESKSLGKIELPVDTN